MDRIAVLASTLMAVALLAACGAPDDTVADSGFRQRAFTQRDGDLTVSVAVLGAEESEAVFGAPLADKGIQPVWLRIRNDGRGPYVFLPAAMDPGYYSPLEAAYRFHAQTQAVLLAHGMLQYLSLPALAPTPYFYLRAKAANRQLDEVFEKLAIESAIVHPGDSLSGFVLARLDQGVKEVRVELVGGERRKVFDFFVAVPGPAFDYEQTNFGSLYPPDSIRQVDDDGLKSVLEALPCCTTNEKGTKPGDPLNIAIVGTLHQILDAFAALGWTETEPMSFDAAVRSARSLFLDRPYHYMPVSPQYHEGRAQDFALQRTRRSTDERLHMRLWYTPVRYKGAPLWVGQVNRDIGVRMTFRTWNLTTHNADPRPDGARDDVVAGLLGTDMAEAVGYVAGLDGAADSVPRHNLTGDPYFTDGYVGAVVLADSNTTMRFFGWGRLTDPADR